MSKYFGTDGFRGEANKALNVEHAYKIGRFLGAYYGREHKCSVVIGKDTRRSGYMFECALTAGLTASGADAYLMHVTTTPSVSYITRTDDFDCGIMISASHNPYFDNGIKLLNGDGEKMEQYVIDEIERYLDGKGAEIPFATGSDIGKAVDYAAGRNRYIGYLISIATRSFKDKTVALDCSNGSASAIAKNVFDALGAKTLVINNEPDGTNIDANCGSTHMDELKARVVYENAAIGIAFDGDADRMLAVDEKGELVDGDQIMAICGTYMKQKGTLKKNTIVVTVMTNLGFSLMGEREGIHVEKTKVGDRYVLEAMMQEGYNIGGEQSGHIILLDYATTGDGQLSGAMILSIMKRTGEKLSQLAKIMERLPQVLINVKVSREGKLSFYTDREIKAEIERVSEILGDRGRILVRVSGTEPLVRVMLEGENLEEIQNLAEEAAQVVRERLA